MPTLADLTVVERDALINDNDLTIEGLAAIVPDEPATLGLLAKVMDFVKQMNLKNVDRNVKLAHLDQRIAALETRAAATKGIEWAGVWNDHTVYQPGQVVTLRGLWLCEKATGSRPGAPTSAPYWKLILKEIERDREARA